MQLAQKNELTEESAATTRKVILDVSGMKCAGCVKAVERQLTQHPGVKSACVNLATEIAVVEIEDAVEGDTLVQLLTEKGFPSEMRNTQGSSRIGKQDQEMRSAFVQLIVAFGLLLFSGLGHFGTHLFPVLSSIGLNNIWFHCALATLALLFPGRPIIIDGWLGWRRGSPNMNTLIALGTLTAYITSLVALLFPQMGWDCFFDEPVMILGFILLGKTLEKQAKGRAASAFHQLLALRPQIARLIVNPDGQKLAVSPNNSIIEIPAEQVRVGEWLQVIPGDKIPVDGQVQFGQTTVDESMLTGEAVPVIKQPGDSVAAGTINQSGTISIVARKIGEDTTLAQIVTLVESAQTRKAPVQKLADTIAGYFTYAVLTASFLTWAFWYFVGTRVWPEVYIASGMVMGNHSIPLPNDQNSALLISLKLAIAVLVVACPCALGLATPTAILVGTGVGAESGLLIKGGDVLEKVHHLNTIVFDKTGTLTTGDPTVTDCLPLIDIDTTNLMQLAAAVEKGTCHPLAKAIQQSGEKLNLPIPHAMNFYTEPGMGVSAIVEGKSVLLGNWEWLNSHGITISTTAQEEGQKLAKEGKTVIGIAVDKMLAGLIAVSDTIRPDAKLTVNYLQRMGLRVKVLSGDRLEAALVIAQQLGLDSTSVIAGVTPEQKAGLIRSLQQGSLNVGSTSCVVAMVGDGINDAPALSQADVGIALGSGTEVAMESAEIVLMGDSLSDVVASIQLARKTFTKIRQNLFWAFAYNTIAIPLAAGVLLPGLHFVLTPSSAAAIMAFSSVSVVTNSLLLRGVKPQNCIVQN
ncbi:copper-translocating P-type ATPase [Raphidiopsis curvata NIES-932]|nr:copper-translocating P-type ATPase [Raphidiopsis curvata NIES-932]